MFIYYNAERDSLIANQCVFVPMTGPTWMRVKLNLGSVKECDTSEGEVDSGVMGSPPGPRTIARRICHIHT